MVLPLSRLLLLVLLLLCLRLRWERLFADRAKIHPRAGLLALCAGALLLTPHAIRARFGGEPQLPDDIYPKEEIAWLVEHVPGERIYNHWNFGGYTIFAARGRVKTFIDGREIIAYPKAVIEDYIRIGNEKYITQKYNLRVAFMPRYIPASLTYFDASPEWEKAFSGKVGNIYIKKEANAAP